MREAVLKLTMDYKMTKHMLHNGTLNESRTWLLVRTWHCYFISFNSEHPVKSVPYLQCHVGSAAIAWLNAENRSDTAAAPKLNVLVPTAAFSRRH